MVFVYSQCHMLLQQGTDALTQLTRLTQQTSSSWRTQGATQSLATPLAPPPPTEPPSLPASSSRLASINSCLNSQLSTHIHLLTHTHKLNCPIAPRSQAWREKERERERDNFSVCCCCLQSAICNFTTNFNPFSCTSGYINSPIKLQ